jgi:phosphatidyl-myo-inositol dimannoside synthase
VKIAILSPEYPPIWGGVGVYAYSLAKSLHALRHEVHVITRSNGLDNSPKLLDGIVVHKVPWVKMPILYSVSFGRNAVKKLIELGNDFDVVHIQCPFTSMSEKNIKKIKSPIVITMHGTWQGERKSLSGEPINNLKLGDLALYLTWPFMEKYEKIILKNSNIVIPVSKYCYEELTNYKISKIKINNKFVIIPNGVDTQAYKPCETSHKLLREKYGFAMDDMVILSVARLAARKGFKDLLQAFSIVKSKIESAKLVIIGSGPLENVLKRMALQLGISNEVCFAKGLTTEELKIHYAGANLFTLPSYYEGQGIVYLEAMASGIPIVATNCSAIPETVRNNENGILIKPHASKELAEAILDLLRNGEMRKEMGIKGREIALKEYDWGIIVKRIEALYIDLAKKQKSM